MTATIGSTIKRLRRERDMTQEQLAEYLSVSPQAVSQWERDISAPDISLIVPLANVFGVTTDELFDRNAASEEEDVKNFIIEGNKLLAHGKHKEYVLFWREKIAVYPRNFRCMEQLAGALKLHLFCNIPIEEKNKCAKESVALCERVLESCTDASIRNSVLQDLVHLYSNGQLYCADEEKAVKYAEMASSCYVCREVLLEEAYFTDEHKQKKRGFRHDNILTFLDLITNRIVCDTRESDEEFIRAHEAALKLWETVITDGNYLFYHTRIGWIHDRLARCYAGMGDKEKTLKHLKLALSHAEAYDRLSGGDNIYTSELVCAASSNIDDTLRVTEEFKHNTEKDSCFDFIRSEPEFIEIIKQ